MVEQPLVHNDEYAHKQNRMLKESESKRSLLVSNRSILGKPVELPTRGAFRFMDSKHERIARQLYLNQILDAVPNRNIDATFNKVIRHREES